jgi:hypothetical protein
LTTYLLGKFNPKSKEFILLPINFCKLKGVSNSGATPCRNNELRKCQSGKFTLRPESSPDKAAIILLF